MHTSLPFWVPHVLWLFQQGPASLVTAVFAEKFSPPAPSTTATQLTLHDSLLSGNTETTVLHQDR